MAVAPILLVLLGHWRQQNKVMVVNYIVRKGAVVGPHQMVLAGLCTGHHTGQAWCGGARGSELRSAPVTQM